MLMYILGNCYGANLIFKSGVARETYGKNQKQSSQNHCQFRFFANRFGDLFCCCGFLGVLSVERHVFCEECLGFGACGYSFGGRDICLEKEKLGGDSFLGAHCHSSFFPAHKNLSPIKLLDLGS